MTRLPPGFRFHPTNVELIKYYLKRKLLGRRIAFNAIAEVDIYKYAPWDLPGKSRLNCGDRKWYFFCSVKKYGRGVRMNRSTDLGYWKSTGKDRPVGFGDCVIGMIKTLVFHIGKSPNVERTDWVMYEYRIEEKELGDSGVAHDSYVLCALFKKDGLGPRTGAQYGAPFREEDWENDEIEDEEVPVQFSGREVASFAALTAPITPVDADISDDLAIVLIQPPPSEPKENASWPVYPATDVDVALLDLPQIGDENDNNILEMLAMFGEENTSYLNINHGSEVEDCNGCQNACIDLASNGVDIYGGLEDLPDICPLADSIDNISGSCCADDSINKLHVVDGAHYLELMDLDVPLSFCVEAAQGEDLEFSIISDANMHGIVTKQPYNLSGADAKSAASFNESPTVCDQENGNGRAAHLLCGIPSINNANSANLKLQVGSGHAQKSLTRGDPPSIICLKKLKDGVMFCHCDGSSTHVKAEVTRTIIGGTKDALSSKLGESSFTCVHGCNVLEVKFGKGTVSSDVGVSSMLVCFLITVAAVITRCRMSMLDFFTVQGILLSFGFICKGSHTCILHFLLATFEYLGECASSELTIYCHFTHAGLSCMSKFVQLVLTETRCLIV